MGETAKEAAWRIVNNPNDPQYTWARDWAVTDAEWAEMHARLSGYSDLAWRIRQSRAPLADAAIHAIAARCKLWVTGVDRAEFIAEFVRLWHARRAEQQAEDRKLAPIYGPADALSDRLEIRLTPAEKAYLLAQPRGASEFVRGLIRAARERAEAAVE